MGGKSLNKEKKTSYFPTLKESNSLFIKRKKKNPILTHLMLSKHNKQSQGAQLNLSNWQHVPASGNVFLSSNNSWELWTVPL